MTPKNPTLGQRPGDRWVVKHPVVDLAGPDFYRFRVAFRWIDASGHVIGKTTRYSAICFQPERRARPGWWAIAGRAGRQASRMDLYLAAVRQRRQTPSGPFTVEFSDGRRDELPKSDGPLRAAPPAQGVASSEPTCSAAAPATITVDPQTSRRRRIRATTRRCDARAPATSSPRALRAHREPSRPARLNVAMKTGIHPEYVDAHVRCTCGNEFMTRSTQSEIHVEICSACHPFYTGRRSWSTPVVAWSGSSAVSPRADARREPAPSPGAGVVSEGGGERAADRVARCARGRPGRPRGRDDARGLDVGGGGAEGPAGRLADDATCGYRARRAGRRRRDRRPHVPTDRLDQAPAGLPAGR